MALTLGIDVACRAAIRRPSPWTARPVWRGRKFFTRAGDLERLWADLDLADPGELTVVLEPTRNAWIVLAQWFRRRGARVVMVPTTQSADLRTYFSKHTKNDRLDSEVLARLPLLHPEGLREFTGASSADPLRRLTKQRSTMVKRRTAVYSRLDALIELLGPAWYDVLGQRLRQGRPWRSWPATPTRTRCSGSVEARLTRFLQARSRGQYGAGPAREGADRRGEGDPGAVGTRGDGLRRARRRHRRSRPSRRSSCPRRSRRSTNGSRTSTPRPTPTGSSPSAPGVGPVITAVIAGRIGDPHRFTSLAAIRAYSGLVPKVNQSGVRETQQRHHQGRRPAAARDAVHRRRPRPPGRSPTRREVRPTDVRRPAPRLRDLPPRDQPAHPDRDLLAQRPALHPARRRRPRDHRSRGPGHRRRALQGRPQTPRQRRPPPHAPAPQAQRRAGSHRSRKALQHPDPPPPA